jgi:hypothetical protein
MSDEFEDALEAEARALRAARSALVDRDTPADRPPGRDRPLVTRLAARLYAAAGAPLRARMLASLVRPLGPLGLVAIASGAFSGFLARGGPAGVQVALDDVGDYTTEQVAELVRFVEQVSPQALMQIARLVADNPPGIPAFSAAVALLLLRLLRDEDPTAGPRDGSE